MALLGKYSLAAGALIASAAALGAQAPTKPVCDIGDAVKGNTARAVLSFNVATQATGSPVAAAKLKDVVKLVETPEKSGDEPVARAYVLGEALSLWLNQPGIGATARRGDLGFTTNPDATIDLVGALDSAFKIVEAAKPTRLSRRKKPRRRALLAGRRRTTKPKTRSRRVVVAPRRPSRRPMKRARRIKSFRI